MDKLYKEFEKRAATLKSKGYILKLDPDLGSVKLRLDGVTVNYQRPAGRSTWAHIIRFLFRTPKGGYVEETTWYSGSPFNNMRTEAAARGENTETFADEIIEHAEAKAAKAPPKPKRYRSKSQLPEPFRFTAPSYKMASNLYDVGEYVTYTGVIEQCRVDEIVAIANNLKITTPQRPDAEPWFRIEIYALTGAQLGMVTDGDRYYYINRRSGRVSPTCDSEIVYSQADQVLIKAAIEVFCKTTAEQAEELGA